MDAYAITAQLQAKMQNYGNDLTDNLHEALAEALGNALEAAADFDDPSIVTGYLEALGHAALETANNL